MKNLTMQPRLASLSILILLAGTAVYGQLPPSANFPKPTIREFEVSGAGTGANQGTAANDINPAGVMTGVYIDGSNVGHGFVGTLGETITSFDAPGAGTAPNQGTNGGCINPQGTIAGSYVDGSNVDHGFVRASDGTIKQFDAPGAGTGEYQGTYVTNINPAGVIVGDYVDGNNVFHGFGRLPNGTITSFDAAGAGTGANQGTLAFGVNPVGAITGTQLDLLHPTCNGQLFEPGFNVCPPETYIAVDAQDRERVIGAYPPALAGHVISLAARHFEHRRQLINGHDFGCHGPSRADSLAQGPKRRS